MSSEIVFIVFLKEQHTKKFTFSQSYFQFILYNTTFPFTHMQQCDGSFFQQFQTLMWSCGFAACGSRLKICSASDWPERVHKGTTVVA